MLIGSAVGNKGRFRCISLRPVALSYDDWQPKDNKVNVSMAISYSNNRFCSRCPPAMISAG